MTLREKRCLFTHLLADLVLWIEASPGWEVALGRDGEKHMKGSLHYVGLAQDLLLYVRGDYVGHGGSPEWKAIGEHWESMHPLCRWGGRFEDDNHLSLEHEGRK